jgi:class 3 adenylate cyclase
MAGATQAPGAGSLAQAMQARIELDQRIEQRFVRLGTFLDVDVVDSYGMKSEETRSERVVVSFERFRAFVGHEIVGQHGQVLNSNGDEVMAFFEKADDAVATARSLLTGLDVFNASQNLLPRPFRVRMGAHIGRSAVDLRAGIAYSPVLDIAGHLQKAAPVGGLMASVELFEALSDRDGFTKAGVVSKTSIEGYVFHPQVRGG